MLPPTGVIGAGVDATGMSNAVRTRGGQAPWCWAGAVGVGQVQALGVARPAGGRVGQVRPGAALVDHQLVTGARRCLEQLGCGWVYLDLLPQAVDQLLQQLAIG